MATIGVFIAEASDLLRIGMSQVINATDGLSVVGECRGGPETIQSILEKRPNIVILSWLLPKCDHEQVIAAIKSELPGTKVLMLLDNESQFPEALAVHAHGYNVKDTAAYVLPLALRSLLEKGGWIGPVIANYLINDSDGRRLIRTGTPGESSVLVALTPKERAVMQLMIGGFGTQDVASELGISIETVRVHIKHINKKLGVKDKAQAIAKVVQVMSPWR